MIPLLSSFFHSSTAFKYSSTVVLIIVCIYLKSVNFVASEEMTFTMTKPNGEKVLGGYNELLRLYTEHEEEIQKTPGYWNLRDKTTDLMAEKKARNEASGESIHKSNREVSDIFWGFMEKQFQLIGMDVKIDNGRVSQW